MAPPVPAAAFPVWNTAVYCRAPVFLNSLLPNVIIAGFELFVSRRLVTIFRRQVVMDHLCAAG